MNQANHFQSEGLLERIFMLRSLKATQQLAQSVASISIPGDVIKLKGPIGVGKTVFARAILRSLGCQEEIPSPTFTLVQTYQLSKLTVWHFDLFRLKHPDEIYELGLEEATLNGLTLIEWPERIAFFSPKHHAEITFSFDPHGDRIATLKGYGNWNKRLIEHNLEENV